MHFNPKYEDTKTHLALLFLIIPLQNVGKLLQVRWTCLLNETNFKNKNWMARGAIIIGYCLLCLSTVSICTSTQKDVQSAQVGPPYSWTNRRYIVKHIFLNVRVCLPMQKKGKKKEKPTAGWWNGSLRNWKNREQKDRRREKYRRKKKKKISGIAKCFNSFFFMRENKNLCTVRPPPQSKDAHRHTIVLNSDAFNRVCVCPHNIFFLKKTKKKNSICRSRWLPFIFIIKVYSLLSAVILLDWNISNLLDFDFCTIFLEWFWLVSNLLALIE